jgi:hypothetical protein
LAFPINGSGQHLSIKVFKWVLPIPSNGQS